MQCDCVDFTPGSVESVVDPSFYHLGSALIQTYDPGDGAVSASGDGASVCDPVHSKTFCNQTQTLDVSFL